MSHRIVRSASRVTSRVPSSPGAAAIITRRRRASSPAPAMEASRVNPSALISLRISRRYCATGSIHHTPPYPNPKSTRSSFHANHRCLLLSTADTSSSRRAIGSTPSVPDSVSSSTADPASSEDSEDAKSKIGGAEEEDDPCPPWQNPLHHNNPDYTRVFAEQFEPGEEMPITPLPPFESDADDGKVLAPPHLHELADQIVKLSLLEVKELVDRVGDHFGFDDEDGYIDGSEEGEEVDPDENEKVEEKTVFELKLMGFDAKSKIKVIKEVRGMAGLGLKEAKEMVEGAPTLIKKDIKREEAEQLKEKLESVGATIEIV